MNKNLSNICRVCMSDGSRNIFKKIITSSCDNVSSPDRLLEKLRYVTMIKINESENLPELLCDLCIIQLNVAYNFKRKAIDTDTKLRQYVIENGLTISENTRSNNQLTQGTLIGNTTSTTSMSIYRHRPFVVLPIEIKSEPVDYEVLSDITIETNTDEGAIHNRNYSTSTPFMNYNIDPVPALETNFVNQSMVQLNDNNLISSAANSDTEFIKSYLLTPSTYVHSPNESLASAHSPNVPSEATVIVANTKLAKSEDNITKTKDIENAKTEESYVQMDTIKSNKLARELQRIKVINMNIGQKIILDTAESYPLRNKYHKIAKINYKLSRDRKKVINPANRLRKKIKLELDQSIKSTLENNDQSSRINYEVVSLVNPTDPISSEQLSDCVSEKDESAKKKTKLKVKSQSDGNKELIKKRIRIGDSDLFSFPPRKKL